MARYKFPKGYNQYGAQMGRHSYGQPTEKAELFRMDLDSGGYDNGGAYWGHGHNPIYVLRTSDSFHTVRAANRTEAFEHFKEMFPDLKLKHGIEVRKPVSQADHSWQDDDASWGE